MFKTLAFIILAFTCVSAYTFPATFIGNNNNFHGFSSVSSTVPFDNFIQILKNLDQASQKTPFSSKYVSSPSEVVLAFLYPSLLPSTPLPSVLSSVSPSRGVRLGYIASQHAIDLPNTIKAKFKPSQIHNIKGSCEQFIHSLQSSSIQSNNQLDIVFVEMDNPANAECASTLLSSFPSSVVLYTSMSDAVTIQERFSSNEQHADAVNMMEVDAHVYTTMANNVQVTSTNKPIGPQYISSNILIAVLISFILLFTLYVAVDCVSSIERPVRLTSVPLQLSKEY